LYPIEDEIDLHGLNNSRRAILGRFQSRAISDAGRRCIRLSTARLSIRIARTGSQTAVDLVLRPAHMDVMAIQPLARH